LPLLETLFTGSLAQKRLDCYPFRFGTGQLRANGFLQALVQQEVKSRQGFQPDNQRQELIGFKDLSPTAAPVTSSHTHPRLTIVHQGALGDFLLALPVFEGLWRLDSDCRLDFWSKPVHVALLAAKSYVGEVHSCDDSALAPLLHQDLWRQAPVPDFFEGTTGVLIFGQSLSRTLAARLARRLACRVAWIQSFPNAAGNRQVSSFLVEQVRLAGWPIEDTVPALQPGVPESLFAREWLRDAGWSERDKPVVLHPGSGGKRKIWPLQKWWDGIWWLRRDRQVPVMLIVGPADESCRALANAALTLGVKLLPTVALPRLAALLAASRLFIGNDSGVTHLAAAMGVPTIAIFGPTAPEVWAPRGDHVQVVRSNWQETENLTFLPSSNPQPLEAAVQAAVAHVLDG
jgi:heptosyltransferase III